MKPQTIIFLTIISILILSCNSGKGIRKEKNENIAEAKYGNLFEETVFATIEAYRGKDEKALNKLIPRDFGIAFLYSRGVYRNLTITDLILFDDPIPEYLPFDTSISTDYKISFEKLPEFSCDTEAWDKPPGIYCDTLEIDKSLSTTAKNGNEFLDAGWPDDEIKKMEDIENASRKIIVIDTKENVFIFYLIDRNNKWHLIAIERFEACGA